MNPIILSGASSPTMWIILGAVILAALGIGIGVWRRNRSNQKTAKERADETISGVHNEVSKGLADSGLDAEARKKIMESDAIKNEVEEISKDPDKAARLKRLAALTNKLTKGE